MLKADVENGLQPISVPKGENPHFSRLPEVSTNMVESTFSVKLPLRNSFFHVWKKPNLAPNFTLCSNSQSICHRSCIADDRTTRNRHGNATLSSTPFLTDVWTGPAKHPLSLATTKNKHGISAQYSFFQFP